MLRNVNESPLRLRPQVRTLRRLAVDGQLDDLEPSAGGRHEAARAAAGTIEVVERALGAHPAAPWRGGLTRWGSEGFDGKNCLKFPVCRSVCPVGVRAEMGTITTFGFFAAAALRAAVPV